MEILPLTMGVTSTILGGQRLWEEEEGVFRTSIEGLRPPPPPVTSTDISTLQELLLALKVRPQILVFCYLKHTNSFHVKYGKCTETMIFILNNAICFQVTCEEHINCFNRLTIIWRKNHFPIGKVWNPNFNPINKKSVKRSNEGKLEYLCIFSYESWPWTWYWNVSSKISSHCCDSL